MMKTRHGCRIQHQQTARIRTRKRIPVEEIMCYNLLPPTYSAPNRAFLLWAFMSAAPVAMNE
jgi:hypothetical protein